MIADDILQRYVVDYFSRVKSLEKKESPIVWISLHFINLKCKYTHYLFKKVNQPMNYQPVIKEVYIITDSMPTTVPS